MRTRKQDENPAMLTDLYELTMAAAYFEEERTAPATFSLFIRDYPENRGYFVNSGLSEVLEFLESFRFLQGDLDFLDGQGLFREDFLHFLGGLRFTGDVFAQPEGNLFFVDEPILEVTAPIIEAQLVETFVINAVNVQTAIATKASRCVHAARGRKLVDFSLRRTQGADAGMKAARSSYLAGFGGTSNVLAGVRYGIPVSGTMAHSFVTSYEDETEAFRAFARTFPENTVLLIDTYDTLAGAKKAVQVAREMRERGEQLRGVRLDSGDMAELSREVRKMFREAGLEDVSIFASGGFDEFKIEDAVGRGAEIDAFGVGTKMGVSADAPYHDIAYKLVEYDSRPVLKLSSGKKTLAKGKQVFRHRNGGRLSHDVIALREEEMEGEPLLAPVMEKGRRVGGRTSLEEIRERFAQQFGELDAKHKALRSPESYRVELSSALDRLQREVIQKVKARELGES